MHDTTSNGLTPYFYVLRTYSHTDRRQLWKVVSRRMQDHRDAVNWMDYQKDICTVKDSEFFIVTKYE